MRKLLVIVGLLAILGVSQAQTLVFGGSGLPVSMNAATDGNSLTVMYQVLENLVAVEPGGTELVPGLATEWSSNEDGTVWTFTLREGVTFQDGTPFNAEAVKFNIDRWNDPNFEFGFRDEGVQYEAWGYVFGGFLGDEAAIVTEANAVDEYTLELVLANPMGFLPAALSSSYFGIHSPAAIQEAGADYGTPAVGAVGTGPFQFSEWVDGSQVSLTRSEDYWGEPAGVEQLVFRGIEDPTARLAELQAGSIDIAVNLSPDDAETIAGDANLETVTAEQNLNIGYIGLHQDNSPFESVEVRRAVAHAIDWNELVSAFFGEGAQVASQFIPPGLIGYSEDLEPYAYDPEMAQQLLSEAGSEGGFSTQFWYMPVSRPYFPSAEPVASAAASYLADIGIEAELQTEDWGTYLDDNNTGKFPIYMLGWSADYADPDNFVYTFFGGEEGIRNFGWDNAEVRDLLDQARQEPDEAARAELYGQINQIIYDEVPAIPVVHNPVLNAVRTGVEGFLPSPLGSTVPFSNITKAN
jgi:peptide/nickel transport system substrate-binding protein